MVLQGAGGGELLQQDQDLPEAEQGVRVYWKKWVPIYHITGGFLHFFLVLVNKYQLFVFYHKRKIFIETF